MSPGVAKSKHCPGVKKHHPLLFTLLAIGLQPAKSEDRVLWAEHHLHEVRTAEIMPAAPHFDQDIEHLTAIFHGVGVVPALKERRNCSADFRMEDEVTKGSSSACVAALIGTPELFFQQRDHRLEFGDRLLDAVRVSLPNGLKRCLPTKEHRRSVQPYAAKLLILDRMCAKDISESGLDFLSERAQVWIASALNQTDINRAELGDAGAEARDGVSHLRRSQKCVSWLWWLALPWHPILL